ncbi:MAG: energy transducer TonB [Gelidibacter sp.]
MEFIEKHKALLLTALISGTVLLALFAFHIKQQTILASESYYEMTPEPTPEEQKLLEELALNDQSSPETNKAFNETSEFKKMMKNFKSVNSNEFEKDSKLTETEATETPEEEVTDTKNNPVTPDYSVNENELSSYSKINDVIAMRSAKKRQSKASNGDNTSDKTSINSSTNTNSSVSYSLVNRKDEHLPPPVYLCEESGKIVINITVDADGNVIDAYVNSSSTSKNECLIESALEYANSARFSSDASKAKQIGSITYYFKGKR